MGALSKFPRLQKWLTGKVRRVFSGVAVELDLTHYPQFDKNWKMGRDYKANCYSYALNADEGGIFNPGDVTRPGNGCTPLVDPANDNTMGDYFNAVVQGVKKDGLEEWQPGTAIGPGQRIVALYIGMHGSTSSGYDYHWYRLDKNGYWSHKQGYRGKVTNRDQSGHKITSPETANRGCYTMFGGYFLVDDLKMRQKVARKLSQS